MADQPQNPNTKKDSDKKQPETVILTADELRSIAGGGSGSVLTNPGGGSATPKDKVGAPVPGK